jgi:hypothetical protein
MKILNSLLIQYLWVIFALLDPAPESESGSSDLIISGSETLVKNVNFLLRIRIRDAVPF